jgi:hypothetical protein
MRSFCTASTGRLIVGSGEPSGAMPLETRVDWVKKRLEGSVLELVGLLLAMFGGVYSLISTSQHSSSYAIAGFAFLILGLGMLWYGNQLVRRTKHLPRATGVLGENDTQVSRFARWLGKEIAGSYKLNSTSPDARNPGSCKFCKATLRGDLAFCPACGKAPA